MFFHFKVNGIDQNLCCPTIITNVKKKKNVEYIIIAIVCFSSYLPFSSCSKIRLYASSIADNHITVLLMV